MPSRLQAAAAFRTSVMKAKDVVRRLINRKIDDFVDLADRDPYVRCLQKSPANIG